MKRENGRGGRGFLGEQELDGGSAADDALKYDKMSERRRPRERERAIKNYLHYVERESRWYSGTRKASLCSLCRTVLLGCSSPQLNTSMTLGSHDILTSFSVLSNEKTIILVVAHCVGRPCQRMTECHKS